MSKPHRPDVRSRYRWEISVDQIHEERRQITEIEGLADQAAGQLDEADWKGDGGERDKPSRK